MVSWAPRLPPAVSGSGARCGRVCWARVSPVLSPSWLGCRGVFFFFFALWFFLFFFFFFFGFVVPVPPSPFFRAGLVALFFFFFSVSLFPVVRCYWLGVAGFGWVVPLCLCGGPPLFFFFFFSWGGGLAACGGVGGWLGGCGLFSCLFPFPPPFFFWGGGGLACSSLCLPWAGARTGLYSVLSSGLLSSVAFCVAMFRLHGSGGLCTRWARRPFLLGQVLALPAGRLRQAAACGFGLGGWGCSCPYPSAVPAVIFWVVRHRCRLARCGPVCGLWCWCVAWWRGAFPGVRWLASVSPSG